VQPISRMAAAGPVHRQRPPHRGPGVGRGRIRIVRTRGFRRTSNTFTHRGDARDSYRNNYLHPVHRHRRGSDPSHRRVSGSIAMKPVAFTPNPGKMGFLELYRVAGSPVVGFIACGLKLFRILGPQHDGYGIRSLGDELERRDIGNLPKHVLEATEGYRDKLERLGFIPCFAYSLETYGAQEGHAIPHRHKSGVAAANVLYTRCVRDDNETMATTFAFNTPLADDTYIVTSGLKKQMRK